LETDPDHDYGASFVVTMTRHSKDYAIPADRPGMLKYQVGGSPKIQVIMHMMASSFWKSARAPINLFQKQMSASSSIVFFCCGMFVAEKLFATDSTLPIGFGVL
jgi:hypothetical protein